MTRIKFTYFIPHQSTHGQRLQRGVLIGLRDQGRSWFAEITLRCHCGNLFSS